MMNPTERTEVLITWTGRVASLPYKAETTACATIYHYMTGFSGESRIAVINPAAHAVVPFENIMLQAAGISDGAKLLLVKKEPGDGDHELVNRAIAAGMSSAATSNFQFPLSAMAAPRWKVVDPREHLWLKLRNEERS